MMLRSCFRPLERCFFGRLGCGSGSGDRLLWHTDLKPHASGDYSIAVVQANSSLEDQSQVFSSPSATYVGVYDGHGGPEASRFVNKRLFPYLHGMLSSPKPHFFVCIFQKRRSLCLRNALFCECFVCSVREGKERTPIIFFSFCILR